MSSVECHDSNIQEYPGIRGKPNSKKTINYKDCVIEPNRRMSNDVSDPVGSSGGADKSKKDDKKTEDNEGKSAESTIDPSKQGEPLKTGWEALLKLDKKVQAQRPI